MYDWVQPASSNDSYAADGLNRYTSAAGFTPSYDANSNLTSDGVKTYSYDNDNRLTGAAGGVSLAYDPRGRLHQVAGAATTRFLYDGADVIAEYDTGGGVLRRYVHGPGTDEPVVWYEGSGTSDRRYLIADERGSVIGVTNSSGTVTTVNRYDAYGVPSASNSGRFQYTGQTWLSDVGLYHYKARAYHPKLGRFLQTDPIGTAGGINLYAYAGNDSVNLNDPSGLQRADDCDKAGVVCVTAPRPHPWSMDYMMWWLKAFNDAMNEATRGLSIGAPSGGDSQEGPAWWSDIKRQVCEVGNTVAWSADNLGDVSTVIEAGGLAATGLGVVTGQVEILPVTLAVAETGAMGNIGAAGLQFAAGGLQGLGGGGYSNSKFAAISLISGMSMGRLLTVRNASRQAGGFIRGGRIVTGGVTDMLTQLVEGAKPKQVDCPGKKK